MCKTLIYNTETNLVASLYVDAPHVVVKSRQHDTSQYASLTTNTNPSRPPFRRRLNLGIRRNTSKDILLRLENECSLRLPDSCDGRVVLSCGANDTAIENGIVRVHSVDSCANVRSILRRAKQYTVLMVGPPPVLDDEQNERIKDLSLAFAHEAQALGVPYIDLFFALCSDNAYKREVARNDGSHPRSEGYSKMAHIVKSSPSWWFHDP